MKDRQRLPEESLLLSLATLGLLRSPLLYPKYSEQLKNVKDWFLVSLSTRKREIRVI